MIAYTSSGLSLTLIAVGLPLALVAIVLLSSRGRHRPWDDFWDD